MTEFTGLVFHQRLYPKYMKIKEMIDSGEMGTLKRVSLINSRYLRTSHYHKSGSWRSSFAGEGGGALINQGQHILDIFQYLFGMPQSFIHNCLKNLQKLPLNHCPDGKTGISY